MKHHMEQKLISRYCATTQSVSRRIRGAVQHIGDWDDQEVRDRVERALSDLGPMPGDVVESPEGRRWFFCGGDNPRWIDQYGVMAGYGLSLELNLYPKLQCSLPEADFFEDDEEEDA